MFFKRSREKVPQPEQISPAKKLAAELEREGVLAVYDTDPSTWGVVHEMEVSSLADTRTQEWPEVHTDARRAIYEVIDEKDDYMDRRTFIKVTSVERPLGEHLHEFPEAFVGRGSGVLYMHNTQTGEDTVNVLPENGWLVVVPPHVAHTYAFDTPGAELTSYASAPFIQDENTHNHAQLKESAFDRRQRAWFTQLALRHKTAFTLHKKYGLWDRNEAGEKDWRNVSAHTLAEAARAEVLAEMFGLAPDLVHDLGDAAIATDYMKKDEKRRAEEGDFSWDAFAESAAVSAQQAGELLGPRVERLADAVGFTSLEPSEELMKRHSLTDEDIAYLIMHYVDDYTIGSDWAADHARNALDARMDKNIRNPRYTRLNEEGREHFDGETTFEAQRRVGHMVEDMLVRILRSRTGLVTTAEQLPLLIDNRIKQKIMEYS